MFTGPDAGDALIAVADLKPRDTVLDLGSGTGLVTLSAAKKAHAVIALDA